MRGSCEVGNYCVEGAVLVRGDCCVEGRVSRVVYRGLCIGGCVSGAVISGVSREEGLCDERDGCRLSVD